MNKLRKLKNLVLDNTYLYSNETTQSVPVDNEGNAILKYINYLSLSSIHNVLESLSEAHSTIVIRGEENKNEMEVDISTSVYIVGVDVMEQIIDLIELIQKDNKPKTLISNNRNDNEDYNLEA